MQADPEAVKRAIANLVDNAAEALQDSMMKQIVISTALLEDRDAVEIIIADTGYGVTPEVKEKLFLPYFSTKLAAPDWAWRSSAASWKTIADRSRGREFSRWRAIHRRVTCSSGSCGRAVTAYLTGIPETCKHIDRG